MGQDIEAISNIAEIFSAVMIIVSLLFVGFQIRDANRSNRSITFQSVQDTETRFIAFAMEHAEIWDRILTHAKFDPEAHVDIRQGVMLISFFMIDTENRFRQYTEGNLIKGSWSARAQSLKNIFRCDLFAIWRASPGASSRSPEFLACVDELYAEMIEQDKDQPAGKPARQKPQVP